MMELLKNVFFWATIATATIVLEILIFISRRKYKRIVYIISGISALIFFEIPRFIIPFLPQPKIGLNPYLAKILGIIIFILGLIIIIISFTQLMIAKKEKWKLRTTGAYGIVRHPMYLGDILWAFGLSIYLNALYSLILTPLWFFLRYSLAVLEEEKLVEKYGETYIRYIEKVPKRLIPYII
ncbi:MAG: hypothetical protein DRP29_05865 [Thermodesulfobacteriota bacterium]|nr:MAG: hypothetical protein DRP29_05865 [Thermodesulfobacteriota bacterium]RLG13022.1 MAG: hypothetical protein DRN73_00525 [Candidatus Pacearchaeota archaeon]